MSFPENKIVDVEPETERAGRWTQRHAEQAEEISNDERFAITDTASFRRLDRIARWRAMTELSRQGR